MEKIIEFIKALAKQKTANPKDIADSISLEISNTTLDALIEELHSMGWIEMLHKQMQRSQLPEYNQVTITEKGIYAAKNPPNE